MPVSGKCFPSRGKGLRRLRLAVVAGAACLAAAVSARARPPEGAPEGAFLPTGVRIDLSPIPGLRLDPLYLAKGKTKVPVSGSFAMAASPAGGALAVVSSGYNLWFGFDGKPVPELSHESVFVFDISQGAPKPVAVLPLPNSFCGIDWNPDGKEFYVSGGGEDRIYAFARKGDTWAPSRPPIALGHEKGNGIETKPVAAGLRVDPEGKLLLVANYANDSVSLVRLTDGKKVAELDLRPGKIDPKDRGLPGGEYPMDVAWVGKGKAYVASLRDREIVVVGMEAETLRCLGRIPLQGQPNRIAVDRDRRRAYVTEDNSDRIAVIETEADRLLEAIPSVSEPGSGRPGKSRKGASPNNLWLDPSGRLLYVTNGGMNCVSVIELGPKARGVAGEVPEDGAEASSRVVALIPTGWYPTAVACDGRGSRLYVATGKSVTGPNDRGFGRPLPPPEELVKVWRSKNEYILQKTAGTLQSFPRPDPADYARLTETVWRNNRRIGAAAGDKAILQMLRRRIHHILYVIKENRGYDQLFGDLRRGDGDPDLAILAPYCPNERRLAERFVLLDHFFCSGEVSGDGWNWSTEARATDIIEKTVPLHYAHRGPTYDFEGDNRNIAVGIGTMAQRKEADPGLPDDPDLLPGTRSVAAPDGSEGEVGLGYLWDAALRKGITVRNYGFFGDLTRYHLPKEDPAFLPLSRHPFAERMIQFFPANPTLAKVSDLYYRGFDMKYADYWRYKEWEREFDDYARKGNLPALELIRLPHDHFGSFREAADKVDTVEAQMADNDYAVGLLVEKVARSRYKDDTLIFVIEDDAQAAADHVDAHRSIALVAGPFVKQGAVIRRRFTTVSVLKTIEEILGFGPLCFYDEGAEPMTDLFDPAASSWSYRAVVPAALLQTDLPVGGKKGAGAGARHDSAFWEKLLGGQDFSDADRLDSEQFNRALRFGLSGRRSSRPTFREAGE
ncbi:bifunctional YncE family protein/alkaline phosphatase family protein [Methylacidimicrobium sp. AP8]|uniref:bifunctional YncE family protein/alkaline phosphatase family protein n=1 Tax=Methylacidimicrobium sp. AP8 TaxID=2730359 RepID=UPI001F2E6208|nr:bifunctional YncE family protein/alkaline phosphatase family protein [Methylacidimicrobium sp. AP8]